MKDRFEHTEKKLVVNLRSGNILAFNQLFEAYSSKLFLFAKGYLKSVEDSEELVQEVFLTVWEKHKEIKIELSFKSWLFTIAFNNIKKRFRQKAQFRRFANTEIGDEATQETAEKIDFNSFYRHLQGILKSLPEKRRLVFQKSRIEGMSNQEIADQLGLTKKTVENHLNLALKQIRQQLSGERHEVNLFNFILLFYI